MRIHSFRGAANQRLLFELQGLRGRVYLADGAIAVGELRGDGRFSEPADYTADHFVAVGSDGRVAGSIRLDGVRAGAWVVALGARRSRVAFALIHALVEFAGRRGLAHVNCDATERHGSAEMLERIGGRPGPVYFSDRWRCEMRSFRFSSAELRNRKLRDALRVAVPRAA